MPKGKQYTKESIQAILTLSDDSDDEIPAKIII